VDTCIIVRFRKKNPTSCKNVSTFYYSIFIWSSTCFGRHTAHHQEPKTALAVSGFFISRRLFGCVVGGRCQVQCVSDNFHQLHVQTTLHLWKTRGCQCNKEKSNKMQKRIKILWFHIYMKLNMFRVTHCPPSPDGTHCTWQRPPTTRPNNLPHMKTRGCQCSFRLLMMDGVSPETCWASYKYWIIKFWYFLHLVGCMKRKINLLNVNTFTLCTLDTSFSSIMYIIGKLIPLQAWRGPEGSRRLRFLDFKTIGTWKW
jgi:hypothetical protein